jgi:hypothetical protein
MSSTFLTLSDLYVEQARNKNPSSYPDHGIEQDGTRKWLQTPIVNLNPKKKMMMMMMITMMMWNRHGIQIRHYVFVDFAVNYDELEMSAL